ncbi:hypothetical protein PVAP13_9KG049157 [Panicum virgatum]|uniref:Uncharacterized protein n=1 Tax=Panicum virgatum TaxID=38727 RepID=A0A8T0NJ15_PANVG|nr:hypothetical protein PVAP13_9KG049157 [Panicum virgatum]
MMPCVLLRRNVSQLSEARTPLVTRYHAPPPAPAVRDGDGSGYTRTARFRARRSVLRGHTRSHREIVTRHMQVECSAVRPTRCAALAETCTHPTDRSMEPDTVHQWRMDSVVVHLICSRSN